MLGLWLLHARPNLFSAQAAVIRPELICPFGDVVAFLFVAFLVFLFRFLHRLWTYTGLCMGPCSLLILPMRRLSMFLHNSLMQGRTCATTWRKPRRRRTEKTVIVQVIPKTNTKQSQKMAQSRCGSNNSHCGNPGSPQPGFQRSQRIAHRA